jgi:hypothetical protein
VLAVSNVDVDRDAWKEDKTGDIEVDDLDDFSFSVWLLAAICMPRELTGCNNTTAI